jgi:hypothetical protein
MPDSMTQIIGELHALLASGGFNPERINGIVREMARMKPEQRRKLERELKTVMASLSEVDARLRLCSFLFAERGNSPA